MRLWLGEGNGARSKKQKQEQEQEQEQEQHLSDRHHGLRHMIPRDTPMN
jgi:hypothetical protein